MPSLPDDAQETIRLEERAHAIRMAMYRTPGLLDRLRAGYEASERGDVVTLEEVERELDRLDEEDAAG